MLEAVIDRLALRSVARRLVRVVSWLLVWVVSRLLGGCISGLLLLIGSLLSVGHRLVDRLGLVARGSILLHLHRHLLAWRCRVVHRLLALATIGVWSRLWLSLLGLRLGALAWDHVDSCLLAR